MGDLLLRTLVRVGRPAALRVPLAPPLVLAILMVCIVTGVASAAEPVRIGHFPNITHAQALVGRANGTFEKRLGRAVDWKVFNAGPSAMEALIAGQLDIAYVGP